LKKGEAASFFKEGRKKKDITSKGARKVQQRGASRRERSKSELVSKGILSLDRISKEDVVKRYLEGGEHSKRELKASVT